MTKITPAMLVFFLSLSFLGADCRFVFAEDKEGQNYAISDMGLDREQVDLEIIQPAEPGNEIGNETLEKLDMLTKENKGLKDELVRMRAKLEVAHSSLILKDELESCKTKLKREKAGFELEKEQLKLDKQKILQKLDSMALENSTIQGKVKKLAQDNVNLKGENQSLNREAAALRKDNSKLLSQVNQLKLEKSDIFDKFKNITRENSGFKDEIAQLRFAAKEAALADGLKKEIHNYKVKNEQIKQRNSYLERDNRLLKEKMDLFEGKTKKSRLDGIILKKDLPEALLKADSELSKLKKEARDMHYNLGVVLQEDKKFDQAIIEYQKALDIDPDDADAHYNLGLIYNTVKNYRDKAIYHYRKYIDLKPDAEDMPAVKQQIDSLGSENKIWGDPAVKGIGDKERLGRWN